MSGALAGLYFNLGGKPPVPLDGTLLGFAD